MTILGPQLGDIPAPLPQPNTKPFWDGCAERRLLFLRCETCERAHHAPAMTCGICGGLELEWTQSGGVGTVYSWTRIWRPQTPAFLAPYVAIIVELDEGWSLISNLIGCDAEAAAIGMRVQVDFHPVGNGAVLPYFRPLVL
ncbi:MAG: Zn-ribbon domain-containing OB-fold protein [Acidimicrobiales bacterium]